MRDSRAGDVGLADDPPSGRSDIPRPAETAGAWRALRRNPARFLASGWPVRSFAYLATGVPIGLFWLVVTLAVLGTGMALAPLGVGLVVLLCLPMPAIGLAAVERRRLRWLDPRPAPSRHMAVTRAGLRPWVLGRLREPVTWREFGYGLLNALLSAIDGVVVSMLVILAAVQVGAPLIVASGDRIEYTSTAVIDTPAKAWAVVPVGLVVTVAGAYLLTLLASARVALTRALLVPSREEELGDRLVEVTASRARMAGAFEAERRRIERDLHDGAQQRLTGLIMMLGLAQVDGDRALIAKAQDEARAALTELRDLVRGIHPSILTDRGLGAAVEALAERSAVTVDVGVDLPVRPPEPIESAAYFAVAESLTNVARHSGAGHARVSARTSERLLVVEVRDDGVGGADPARGTGLQGLADRIAAHSGSLKVSSPPGGPTIVRVEIPCG